MAVEAELKFTDVDHAAVRALLLQNGAAGEKAYFEQNLVFDSQEQALRKEQILLRLRHKPGGSLLTLKRPDGGGDHLKRCREWQTRVEDGTVMRRILEELGFAVSFAYEKTREKWTLDGCVICLDHLPFGEFMEIEGPEERLPEVAGRLNMNVRHSTAQTYHALHQQWRVEQKLPLQDGFVFSDEEREKLLRDISDERDSTTT
ncbi:adenylate cyclase, class 2 [Paucidesulfovibrio gracilis DSM 16080]|uniref:Adenylate cyclase, class 2 n=1 Tax=Paucidesulfovibrio gracilis DSM 16080 TaxID=1121449 RepID=A0A1T4WSD3_9BACT|nr:class IV adenylate cyclase [Paucidesulfovibrio gracilis]SKA80283.1 adenylate cyclase, class 2 [Paucidesulfovibrio gracilis DSM 16080]